jgi:hypothetical protein
MPWKVVDENELEDIRTLALKIAGGWLYRTVTTSPSGDEQINLQFVSDWALIAEAVPGFISSLISEVPKLAYELKKFWKEDEGEMEIKGEGDADTEMG